VGHVSNVPSLPWGTFPTCQDSRRTLETCPTTSRMRWRPSTVRRWPQRHGGNDHRGNECRQQRILGRAGPRLALDETSQQSAHPVVSFIRGRDQRRRHAFRAIGRLDPRRRMRSTRRAQRAHSRARQTRRHVALCASPAVVGRNAKQEASSARASAGRFMVNDRHPGSTM